MQHRRSVKLLAAPILAAVVLAACGSDKKSETTSAPTTTAGTETTAGNETTTAPATTTGGTEASTASTAGGAAAVSLKGDCPDTVTIQTDWMPEAEHGFLYQLVGEGYTLDKGKAAVEGPLVDSNGNDTGVKIRIQSGGKPQGFQSVSALLYQDPSILLGFVYTDEAVQFSGSETPTVAIESGYNKDPQMVMWDPATYPDVTGIKDLGTKGVKIRYFTGAAWMDYFTSTGVLSKDQVEGGYSGDPSLFIGDDGKTAQQGFGSAEPYLYEKELKDWMKPVKFQYISELGWEPYAESIATKPENVKKYAACFKKLVPLIQRASVDYLTDPAQANKVILDADEGFGADFGWEYTAGAADYGVSTIKKDGLVANGADGVMGKFDMDRVAGLIKVATPVYAAGGTPPKEGVKPEDIVTNEFIDDSIHL